MKKTKIVAVLLIITLFITGCSDSDIASGNLKKESEQFRVLRKVTFINNVTGEILLTIEGNCSVENNVEASRLELTCKTSEDEFKMHYLGLNETTTYLVEQLEWVEADKYKYKIVIKPESILVNPEIETSKNN